MHLLDANTLELVRFNGVDVPKYAILSHTWDDEEVTMKDIHDLERSRRMKGFEKIAATCRQALKDGMEYAWVDTCCIDKDSSAELSEAINSMFNWYKRAEICYVFLADVPGHINRISKRTPPDRCEEISLALVHSRWFTRGWTLQELIAPRVLRFYNADWLPLGSRQGVLLGLISKHTGIDVEVLQDPNRLASISIAKRMSWAAHRQTTRKEDEAYCLLGIFGVNMPLLYGEEDRAFLRLQEEIIRFSTDQSIFAWSFSDQGASTYFEQHMHDLLAPSVKAFANCHSVVTGPNSEGGTSFDITNTGLQITLGIIVYFVGSDRRFYGTLNCWQAGQQIAIRLRSYELDRSRIGYSPGKRSRLQFRASSVSSSVANQAAVQHVTAIVGGHSEFETRVRLVDRNAALSAQQVTVTIKKTFQSVKTSRATLWLRLDDDYDDVKLWSNGVWTLLPDRPDALVAKVAQGETSMSFMGGIKLSSRCDEVALFFCMQPQELLLDKDMLQPASIMFVQPETWHGRTIWIDQSAPFWPHHKLFSWSSVQNSWTHTFARDRSLRAEFVRASLSDQDRMILQLSLSRPPWIRRRPSAPLDLWYEHAYSGTYRYFAAYAAAFPSRYVSSDEQDELQDLLSKLDFTDVGSVGDGSLPYIGPARTRPPISARRAMDIFTGKSAMESNYELAYMKSQERHLPRQPRSDFADQDTSKIVCAINSGDVVNDLDAVDVQRIQDRDSA